MHVIYFHCSAISAATGNFYYVGIYHSFGFYRCIVLCGVTIAYCDYRRGVGNAGGGELICCSHGRGMWGRLWFSCGIAQCGAGFDFYFLAVFCWCRGNFGFGQGGWVPYNSMKFKIFLSFPNFPGSQDFLLLSRLVTREAIRIYYVY